jgi:hypothetical protein
MIRAHHVQATFSGLGTHIWLLPMETIYESVKSTILVSARNFVRVNSLLTVRSTCSSVRCCTLSLLDAQKSPLSRRIYASYNMRNSGSLCMSPCLSQLVYGFVAYSCLSFSVNPSPEHGASLLRALASTTSTTCMPVRQ